MASWQLKKRPPNSGSEQIIILKISELDNFDRSPDGNCVEAKFTAKDIGIRARDLVSLEADTGNGFTRVWTGYVAVPGAVNDDLNPAPFSLVGLKQRFAEIQWKGPVLARADVGAQVRAILADPDHLPAGVSYNSTNVPNLGFINGQRFYAGESVKEVLDALAEMVPGVTWGVNADGAVFFKKESPSDYTFTHGVNTTEIVFEPVNAEEVVTKVALEVPGVNLEGLQTGMFYEGASFASSQAVFPAFYIHAEDLNNHFLYNAWRKITWPGGIPPYYVPAGQTTTFGDISFTNPNHALDNSPDTFANLKDVAPGSAVSEGFYDVNYYTSDLADGFQYSYISSRALKVKLTIQTAIPPNLHQMCEYVFELPATEEDVVQNGYKLVPHDVRFNDEFADAGAVYSSALDIRFPSNPELELGAIKLYDFRMIRLDRNVLRDIASAYFIPPRQEAAKVVRVREEILQPRHHVTLVKDGLTLQRKAALYRVSITKDGGIENTVMIEQPTDAETISQNYVSRTDRKNDIRRERRQPR